MKAMIIAAVTITGLGGSAGAGYYIMSRSAPPAAAAETEAPAYVDPVKDPQFVKLDPLVVPVIEDGIIRRNIFLQLSLEVDGKDRAQHVLEQKIRLHHAFLMALYDGAVETVGGDPSLDPQKVKTIVLDKAHSVLGDQSVTAVRIEQAIPGAG